MTDGRSNGGTKRRLYAFPSGSIKIVEQDFQLSIHAVKYDTQCRKRALMQCAGNAGPGQPAHSRRLIQTFAARLYNQWIL